MNNNREIIELNNILAKYEDEIVIKAIILYNRSGVLERNEIKPLERYALDKAYDEYIDNENMKFINEELIETYNETRKKLSDEDLVDELSNLINELEFYSYDYRIKSTFGMEHNEKFDNAKIEELITGDNIEKLNDYLIELKDDDQINYLVAMGTFNSECYDNMVDKIIPSLEYLKKEEKEFEI